MRSERQPTILVERIYLNTKENGSVSCSVVWDSSQPYGLVACLAPLSMDFSRQEFCSGLPYPFSRGSAWRRDRTRVSCIAGGFFTIFQGYQGSLTLSNFKVDVIHFCFLTWLPLRQYYRDSFVWDRKQLEDYFGGSDSANHWLPGNSLPSEDFWTEKRHDLTNAVMGSLAAVLKIN